MGFQEVKRDQSYEEKQTNGPHGMLSIFDDNHWSDQPSNSEEKINHLNPVILCSSSEQLEDAQITQDIEHATTGRSDEHRAEKIDEGHAPGADDKRDAANYEKADVD